MCWSYLDGRGASLGVEDEAVHVLLATQTVDRSTPWGTTQKHTRHTQSRHDQPGIHNFNGGECHISCECPDYTTFTTWLQCMSPHKNKRPCSGCRTGVPRGGAEDGESLLLLVGRAVRQEVLEQVAQELHTQTTTSHTQSTHTRGSSGRSV